MCFHDVIISSVSLSVSWHWKIFIGNCSTTSFPDLRGKEITILLFSRLRVCDRAKSGWNKRDIPCATKAKEAERNVQNWEIRGRKLKSSTDATGVTGKRRERAKATSESLLTFRQESRREMCTLSFTTGDVCQRTPRFFRFSLFHSFSHFHASRKKITDTLNENAVYYPSKRETVWTFLAILVSRKCANSERLSCSFSIMSFRNCDFS